MSWVLSGDVTISAEAVEPETGDRRNVCFKVPYADENFVAVAEQLWHKSFEELAWQATQPKESDNG